MLTHKIVRADIEKDILRWVNKKTVTIDDFFEAYKPDARTYLGALLIEEKVTIRGKQIICTIS